MIGAADLHLAPGSSHIAALHLASLDHYPSREGGKDSGTAGAQTAGCPGRGGLLPLFPLLAHDCHLEYRFAMTGYN